MTARPWGTTGRVTLKQYIDTDGEGHADYDVLLDGENVGRALCVSADDEWEASEPYSMPTTLPSLDAAVMWVLRRADANVWRQERGPVCWVRWRPEAKPYPWHLTLPGGSHPAATYGHHSWAMTDGRTVATNLASQAARDLS